MAKRQQKPYGEPWKAERSPLWTLPYRGGPPTYSDGTPAEQRQVVVDWEAKKARAEQNADWILWGRKLTEPGVCTSLEGKKTLSDDRGIIAVAKRGGWSEGQPTHEEYARRIADCVSAMAGIADPAAWIADVKELLGDMRQGEADRSDVRVATLLLRCVPEEEIPI